MNTTSRSLSAPVGNFYLNVRCEYVLAKLTRIGNPDRIDSTHAAEIDAQWLGYRDAETCDDSNTDMDIPAFFADVPDLSRAWLSGWRTKFEMIEIEHCSGCDNEHGHPCRDHDRIVD